MHVFVGIAGFIYVLACTVVAGLILFGYFNGQALPGAFEWAVQNVGPKIEEWHLVVAGVILAWLFICVPGFMMMSAAQTGDWQQLVDKKLKALTEDSKATREAQKEAVSLLRQIRDELNRSRNA